MFLPFFIHQMLHIEQAKMPLIVTHILENSQKEYIVILTVVQWDAI